ANRTLIESWNGTSWTVATSPNTGTSVNLLNGVSCVAANSCTAVGYYYNGTTNRTLIESWNGTSWTVATSPNTGTTTTENILDGVSCVTANACKAVGHYGSGTTARTLIESWNGTSWTVA